MSNPTTIQLTIGAPDTTMIPFDLLSNASQEIFADDIGKQKRTYWSYAESAGSLELRHHIVDFLRQSCDISTLGLFIKNVRKENVMIELVKTRQERGDTILVECPTFFYALEIFHDHHLQIVSCPTDDDGLTIGPEFVTDVLERVKPKMVYIVPTFQNPGGFTMSNHRREQLLQLSLKYHFLILADEVYHFLDYGKTEQNGIKVDNDQLIEYPKSFATYHATGTVIALHSFSKVLTPSLRLGFACASHEHVNAMSRYGLTHSGGGAGAFISGIIDRILAAGLLKKFIDEKLCVEYGKRVKVLHNALMETFGEKCITCRRPSGGYYLWVKFNDSTVDCDKLLTIAEKHGVSFKPGSLFAHDEQAKARLTNCLRLCFVTVDCEQLIEGCARLKQAFDEYKNISL